jgi:hypothetical protein
MQTSVCYSSRSCGTLGRCKLGFSRIRLSRVIFYQELVLGSIRMGSLAFARRKSWVSFKYTLLLGCILELLVMIQMRSRGGGTIMLRDGHVDATCSQSMYRNGKLSSPQRFGVLCRRTLTDAGSNDLVG